MEMRKNEKHFEQKELKESSDKREERNMDSYQRVLLGSSVML